MRKSHLAIAKGGNITNEKLFYFSSSPPPSPPAFVVRDIFLRE